MTLLKSEMRAHVLRYSTLLQTQPMGLFRVPTESRNCSGGQQFDVFANFARTQRSKWYHNNHNILVNKTNKMTINKGDRRDKGGQEIHKSQLCLLMVGLLASAMWLAASSLGWNCCTDAINATSISMSSVLKNSLSQMSKCS